MFKKPKKGSSMIAPNNDIILAKNLGKLAKVLDESISFKVLFSDYTPNSTIYTFTHITGKEEDDSLKVHCTYEFMQDGKKYTQSNYFPGGTKIILV